MPMVIADEIVPGRQPRRVHFVRCDGGCGAEAPRRGTKSAATAAAAAVGFVWSMNRTPGGAWYCKPSCKPEET